MPDNTQTQVILTLQSRPGARSPEFQVVDQFKNVPRAIFIINLLFQVIGQYIVVKKVGTST